MIITEVERERLQKKFSANDTHRPKEPKGYGWAFKYENGYRYCVNCNQYDKTEELYHNCGRKFRVGPH